MVQVTKLEIHQALQRKVDQERWTGLDRTPQREACKDGPVQIKHFSEPKLQRLQRLGLGLEDEPQPGAWAEHADSKKTLRALGERGDIIRSL